MLITIQKGLGDAIYAQPVIRELAKFSRIELETEFSELFIFIPNVTTFSEFTKEQIKFVKKIYWYTNYPNAFNQLCHNAQVGELDFNFEIQDEQILMFETDKKLCIVKPPYTPQYLSNTNKHYKNFAGNVDEIQDFINNNRKEFYFIATGQNTEYTAKLENIDCDLNDKLTLLQFLTLCKKVDLFVTQIGHLLAIACAFKKRIKIVSSNNDNPQMYKNRLRSGVIPDTCILI